MIYLGGINKVFLFSLCFVLLFGTFFVEAGTFSQGWNFVITGYAVDDTSTAEVVTDVSLYLDSAGMTPDSSFYFVDTFFDRFQSSESLTQEKLGEMGEMISQGEFEFAGEASDYYVKYIAQYDENLQESVLDEEELLQYEQRVYTYDTIVRSLKLDLVERVVDGSLSEENAVKIGIDAVQDGTLDLKQDVIQSREDYVENYATSEGISIIESELHLQEQEVVSGVDAYQDQVLREDLPIVGESYVALEEELQQLIVNTDELSVEDKLVFEHLLGEIELHLEEATGSYEDGFYGDTQAKLADAEDLLLYTDEIINNWPIEDVSNIQERMKLEEKERNEEFQREQNEYDQYLERMLQEYPERSEEIKNEAEKIQKVTELDTLYEEQFESLYSDLVDEGKTTNEAAEIMSERWRELYLEAYGEPYTPPGFYEDEFVDGEEFEVIRIVDRGESDSTERGGFVKNHEYIDPITGNTYMYTDIGYSYVDFLGQEHEIVYEEDFKPQEVFGSFEDGSEIYEYTVFKDGEEVSYKYTATGYTVVDEEGKEVITEVYPEGFYETVDGRVDIEINTFGFEINSEDGDSVIYEYSPEFQNYVSTNGQVYIPPQGAAYHYKAVDYSGGIYKYSSGADKWVYDSVAGVWTSTDGEVYIPYVISVAPTGYEDYGRYESESGKVWNYDNGQWRSDAGDKWTYNQDQGTWKNPETGVAYNPSLTYQTYNYYDSDPSRQNNYQSYTNYKGVSWSFDEDTNSWVSGEGESYYVPYYSSYDMGYHDSTETGGDTSGYSYSYYGYHTDYSNSGTGSPGVGSEYQDVTWSYNSNTGGWESSSGTTYYTPISTNYYSPSYTGGVDSSSGESWSYNSDTGNWISSSGGVYAPTTYTYYSGSYSSGDGSSGSSGYSYSGGYSYMGGGGYDSSGSYVGGEYGGYDSSGTYVGGESWSYDSSTGTYSNSNTGGSYSAPSYYGSYSDGNSGGSYSGGGDSGGSGGGDSGGSGGGDSGGSAVTGYVSLGLYRSFR